MPVPNFSALSLGQKQRLFSKMAAQLILKAYEMGYEITLGDAFRDPRVFGPMGVRQGYGVGAYGAGAYSLGVFLQSTEDHRPLGEWWESQGGTWGGRFNDGNHYSLEHNGVK